MHNKLIGVQEEEVEAHKKNAEEIGKRPGLTYAKRIAPTWLGEWGNKNLNYSNQEAARRIIDHLKKTKSERDNAAVIDALKGAADKLGSSGGSSK
jgi:hypothetical protein